MPTEVRVPTLPESVNDATVLTWHKQVGDRVSRDENLVDLETDKVVLEVPAPVDGVLEKITADSGVVVNADDLLANIRPGGSAKEAPTAPAAETTEKPDVSSETVVDSGEPVLTPAVRRLVKELDIDISQLTGTGKDGRILKSDVTAHLEQQSKESDPDRHDLSAIHENAAPEASRQEKRVPMSRLRARIAERLIEAQQNAAILTTFNEVNMKPAMDMRRKYKDAFEKTHDVRLGFMSFFVKAAVEALKKFPLVNASVDGTDIIYHSYYDIGIAVGSPRGLVVPILRDADELSFAETESSIRAFGQKAQDGTLSYDDLTGGTFTISNGGVFGSMLSTPILNPPQSAILGMHSITERAVVENDKIVIRPMMYLALSYDHGIVDGREAEQFLVTIKESLEDPARMLLHI